MIHQCCGRQESGTIYFVPREVVVGILLWGCLFFRETLAGAPGPETLPQPGTSRAAWMSPLKTPDGRFLAWRFTKREEDSTVQELRGKFSDDDCRTWSEERLLREIPLKDKGTYHTGLGLLDRDGAMHIMGLHYYGTGPKGFHGWEDARSLLYHLMSTDGGKTWSQPQHADFGYLYTGALNSLVQLKSGRILASISYYSKRMTGDFIGKLSISDNGGKTWRPSRGEVVVDTGGCALETGASEPVCIQLEDGRIWMLTRAQDGYLHEAFSTDEGETWSEPLPSRFVSSNAPAALMRLRDGPLVVAWNNSTGPRRVSGIPLSYARRVLTLATSDDEGKTWHGYREVARNVEYPALKESSDGAILVYSRKFTRVSPDWLMEKSFSDRFQKGLENWYTEGCEGVEAIPHPDRPEARVLSMRKPRVKVPAGASLNFPFGVRGKLSMRIRMNRNDGWINRQHYYFCLTDFFCMPRMPDVGPGSGQFETGWGPFPAGGRFTWRIGPDGEIGIASERGIYQTMFRRTHVYLQPDVWHTLDLEWDCEKGRCVVTLDDRHVATLPQLSRAAGICYLRMWMQVHTLEPQGILVESVDIQVRP